MTTTANFAGFDVPVLERGTPPAGRYANWVDTETEKRPQLITSEVQREVSLALAERRLLADRDGFHIFKDTIEPDFERWLNGVDHFGGRRWYFDGKGRGVRRVVGGDFVSYVTCPSVNTAAGATTAASVSIQVLPDAVSPLLAGAGGATGGSGGFWYPGRTIQYTFFGSGTTSTTPGSTVFQANIATSQNVTTGNVLGNVTTSVALAASQSNISFTINGWATCRTTGTGGTIIGFNSITLGVLASTNVTNVQPPNTPATVTIDTTSNSAINYLLTLGATTVSFTVQMMIWQFMN